MSQSVEAVSFRVTEVGALAAFDLADMFDSRRIIRMADLRLSASSRVTASDAFVTLRDELKPAVMAAQKEYERRSRCA